MGKEVLFILVILIFSYVSAITINEIELNPAGSDSGNEWIEFYSNISINLSFYSIKNNDGDEINLSGNFSGYFVLILSSQWLDNSDEKVFLYDKGDLVDETSILKDSKNDAFAFSFCNEGWIFIKSSKGEENNCPGARTEPPPNNESGNDTAGTDDSSKKNEKKEEEVNEKIRFLGEVIQDISPEKNSSEPIRLNSPKDIKSKDSPEEPEKKDYSKYLFVVFLVFLLFLYLVKPKKRKNEWKR